jgi:hypothetical protein
MMYKVARLALFVAMGVGSSASAFAATIAPCNASFTACSIVENTSLQLPFFAIAGDVIVRDPGTSVVSDVFRIFNNVLDTGGGTGLGNMVFLYSADDGALPNPATYSANAVFIEEAATTDTTLLANGTVYTLDTLAVPEPSTFVLVSLGGITMLLLARSRSGAAP